MTSPLTRKLLIALGITVVLGVIYYMTIGSADEVPPLGTTVTADEITERTNKILEDTQKLMTYDLDVSIFSDPRFESLQSFKVEIDDVETGRDNPFVPVR